MEEIQVKSSHHIASITEDYLHNLINNIKNTQKLFSNKILFIIKILLKSNIILIKYLYHSF